MDLGIIGRGVIPPKRGGGGVAVIAVIAIATARIGIHGERSN